MRRAERELADPAALERILQVSQVLFLALRDEPAPYVLPVCFGFENGVIYVHSAAAGTKIDLISRHPMVGFSTSTEMTIIPAASPCGFSSKAESVVGTGRAEILTEEAARRHGLDVIMRHYARHGTPWNYSGTGSPVYQPASFARTCVIAVRVGTMRGKRTG
jgi:nitroimidazol reductase NimA-like FMN-containing flavoprotein (pyridoxamine 5'-phosphate oxidase superfamily)